MGSAPDPLKAWSLLPVAEEQELSLLVSEGGPFRTLPTLADACRKLIREELIRASHENARDRLSQLGWRSLHIEATLQRWRTPSPHPRSIETCPEFDQEVQALPPEDQAAVAEILGGRQTRRRPYPPAFRVGDQGPSKAG